MDNRTFRDSNPGTVFPVPGLRIEEFLIRKYSFALSLITNCNLCVVTMVTHNVWQDRFGGGGFRFRPLNPCLMIAKYDVTCNYVFSPRQLLCCGGTHLSCGTSPGIHKAWWLITLFRSIRDRMTDAPGSDCTVPNPMHKRQWIYTVFRIPDIMLLVLCKTAVYHFNRVNRPKHLSIETTPATALGLNSSRGRRKSFKGWTAEIAR